MARKEKKKILKFTPVYLAAMFDLFLLLIFLNAKKYHQVLLIYLQQNYCIRWTVLHKVLHHYPRMDCHQKLPVIKVKTNKQKIDKMDSNKILFSGEIYVFLLLNLISYALLCK